MKFQIQDAVYPVLVEKKKTTKNLYIRIKDDLTIYVTCNIHTSEEEIKNVLLEHEKSIVRMIEKAKKKKEMESSFYLLGKKYDIVYTDFCDIKIGEDKVFLSRDFDLDKWKKQQALHLFQSRLDWCYQNFSRNIPRPTLRLRKMKTRWGVCNTRTHVITLNTELITKDLHCLDYVIIHELAHLVEANHSRRFWKVVEENCKDYKKYRKLVNNS